MTELSNKSLMPQPIVEGASMTIKDDRSLQKQQMVKEVAERMGWKLCN
jgi:hypothetical protein